MYWPAKEDIEGSDYKLTALEFLAGDKYGFGSGFYGLAELGLSSFTGTLDIEGSGTLDESESKFMFAPGVGYAWKGLTIEAKYYLLDSDFANVRFRVGYDFAL